MKTKITPQGIESLGFVFNEYGCPPIDIAKKGNIQFWTNGEIFRINEIYVESMEDIKVELKKLES